MHIKRQGEDLQKIKIKINIKPQKQYHTTLVYFLCKNYFISFHNTIIDVRMRTSYICIVKTVVQLHEYQKVVLKHEINRKGRWGRERSAMEGARG